MKIVRLLYVLALAALPFLQTPAAWAQGSLTPPGAPAPTMKSLNQVEPRTDIATLPTASDSMFVISTAGSYYLSGNLLVTKTFGIKVTVNDVTIDLNGFVITCASGSAGNAILSSGNRCTVKNGTIDGNFGVGVEAISGGNSCFDLTIAGMSDFGIYLGESAQVDRCKVDNSGGGIYAGDGSTVSHCAVTNIHRDNGYNLGAACTLSNSTAFHCSGPSAIFAEGSHSVLLNCAAAGNSVTQGVIVTRSATLTNCSSTGDSGPYGIWAQGSTNLNNCSVRDFGTDAATGVAGIAAGNGSTFNGCSTSFSQVHNALTAGQGSTLMNCTANDNISSASNSSGIAVGQGSTLTNCSAVHNTNPNDASFAGLGIYLSTGSTMQNCTARGNHGDGIRAEANCTITSSSTLDNGGALTGSGMNVGDDAVISSCSTNGNRFHGIIAGQRCKIDNVNANRNGNGTVGSGISTDTRAMVTKCSATDNRKSGIVVLSESVVADCRASHNGLGVAAAGIDSTVGGGSRIEGNQARDNTGTGILANPGDIVIRNSAGSNTAANFNPSSGPNFAPLQAPSATTNPVANISY